MKILFTFIIFIISYIFNYFLQRYIVRNEIKNNIDLFIKKHESLVIHEVNNELFKKDLEVLNVK